MDIRPPQPQQPQVIQPTPAGQPASQTPSPAPLQPSAAPHQPVSQPPAPKPKKHIFRKILTIFMLLLLLAGIGALGYLLYDTNNQLEKSQQELLQTKQTVEQLNSELADYRAGPEFIANENNADMSRRLCSGTPVGMFDVHINQDYATFRYLCSNATPPSPILIGALKKAENGAYEFTYGSTTVSPNALPGYIYDSEPDFFGPVYGTTRF